MLLLLLLYYILILFIYLIFFFFLFFLLSPLSSSFSSSYPLHLLPLPIPFSYTSKPLPILPSNFSLLIFFSIIFLYSAYISSSWLSNLQETHYTTHTSDDQLISFSHFFFAYSLLAIPFHTLHSQHPHTIDPHFLFHFFFSLLPTHTLPLTTTTLTTPFFFFPPISSVFYSSFSFFSFILFLFPKNLSPFTIAGKTTGQSPLASHCQQVTPSHFLSLLLLFFLYFS